jgi:hypothetical protein
MTAMLHTPRPGSSSAISISGPGSSRRAAAAGTRKLAEPAVALRTWQGSLTSRPWIV